MKIFRKLLIVLLLTLTIPTAKIFADFRTVDYNITFTDNHGYDLETGAYGFTPNYQVTNKMEIKFNDITIDKLDNFNHLLYFDKNNSFIGYYNTLTNDYETSKYLGVVNSFTPTIPTGAKYFAFQSFYPYYNLTPIPEIGATLNAVFGGGYDLFSTLNTLDSVSTGLDVPIAELNTYTLREVFESPTPALDNLVTNGDTFASGWILENATGSVVSGVYQFIASALNGKIRYDISGSGNSNDIYLFIAKVKTTSNQVHLSHYGGYLEYHSGSGNYEILKSSQKWELAVNNRLYITDSRSSGWTQIDVDYAMAFNLTVSHGVTSTSGTTYDNAVAEIEWLLSKNNGYIQSVGNPFEIVDLTVSEMDYWFNVYQAISTNNSDLLTSEAYDLYINGIYKYFVDINFPAIFYYNGMTNYWSPIYETTFSNLNNTQIINQYNWFVLNPTYMLDFADLNWYPTDTELENYYLQYNTNLLLDAFYFDTITFAELQTVSPTYTYEYTVDTRDPVTKLNDFLDEINLGSTVFKFSISIIIIILSMILLYVFFKPSALVLIIDGILFTILFVFIGWIPNYIIILLGAILFYLLVKNGGSNNEE